MSAPASLLRSAALEFEAGNVALSKREVESALAHFSNAEAKGYESNACAAGRWNCWMLLFDFERAWQESDSMSRRGSRDPYRLWDGLSFSGKHIVVRCLHGFGDSIQFIRYVLFLRQSAASVTVETHPELVSLFSNLSLIDKVVTWADGSSKRLTNWDQQIEVMEFPWAFRTTAATVPAEVPYLHVNSEGKHRMSGMLGTLPAGIKVGLVWRSGDWNPARSVPVTEFANLMSITGIAFFSFQHGPGRVELNHLREYGEIYDTSELSPDISDTAAAMLHMDLLITVDTMSAHLAGALGLEVWTLLPFAADWRWMLNTVKSPWYPTMTLFRQEQPGNWHAVLKRVESKLRLRSDI